MGPRLSLSESDKDVEDCFELSESDSVVSAGHGLDHPGPSLAQGDPNSDWEPLSHSTKPSPPYRFIVILSYFTTVYLTSSLVRWAAVLHQGAVLSVPIAQAIVWALLTGIWGRCQPRGKLSGKAGVAIKGEEGKGAVLIGVLTSLSSTAHLFEARTLEPRLWQAIQVFVLPFALLLPALVPATFRRHLALPGKRPPFLHLALVGASFVVGIALIGVPAIEHGLILSVVRLPLEAVRLSLLKSHLGPDRVGGILVASALVAGLCSLVTLIVVNLFAPESNPAPLESPQIKLLATFAVLGTLNEVLLVGSVHLFRSLLSPLALVLPRNTILLWVSRLGHHGLPLRENWAQMMFVLPVGTAGWLLTDAEFAGAWRALGSCANWGLRRLRQRAGAPLPESEPASPGLARPVKSHKLARAAVSPLLALLALLPLVVYLLQSPAGASSLSTACLLLPDGVRASVCSQKALVLSLDAGTVDLVFSYYDEDMDGFKEHVNNIRRVPFVSEREVRVLVYNKGARTADEIRANLGLGEGDEVVGLPNLGREGATYLEHILRHYNDSVTVLAGAIGGLAPTRYGARTLAGHTFFLQPHLAWHWIAQPRIDSVGPDTGFAHFGPLMKNWCGRDDRGVGEYPLVKELYSVFVQDLCPPEGVLTAWSAQFVASRRRILAHPYQRYAKVAGLIEAPKGHWLHGTWGPNNSGGPSNPSFGHSLERAWPLIFGCSNPKIAETCPDDKHDRAGCQCFDE